MEARSLKYIAEATGAILDGVGEGMIERIGTDSRQMRPGDLFVAVAGEKFDGHDFAGEVARAEAGAMLVEQSRLGQVRSLLGAAGKSPDYPLLLVPNTRQAYGALAGCYRLDFDLPVFAVAGSNGKTTTKELMAAVLRQQFHTLWSEASYNNDIGVPATLLKLERGHQAAVFEVGTNHPGELAPLVRLIRPRYGIITNIGREHLEFFGDPGGVAEEEGWLAELLPGNGKLFLNGDNEWTEFLVRRSKAEVVLAGLGVRNDWRALDLRMDATGVRFTVAAPDARWSGEYRINLLGRHQVGNALFALMAGAELGLDAAVIQQGLMSCAPPKMRLQAVSVRGAWVLDDTYNANADSMLAGLETLAGFPCSGRRWAVLGDMAELGGHAEAAHVEVGGHAARLQIDCLVALGKFAGVTADAARQSGLKAVFEVADAAAAAQTVLEHMRAGDVILLKASRASRLERVVERLRSQQPCKPL